MILGCMINISVSILFTIAMKFKVSFIGRPMMMNIALKFKVRPMMNIAMMGAQFSQHACILRRGTASIL